MTDPSGLARIIFSSALFFLPLSAAAEDRLDFSAPKTPPLTAPTTAPQSAPTTPYEAAFNQGLQAYDAQNYEKAFHLWLPLARGNDLAAQRNIGHMLRRGLGVTRDPKRAIGFYERAAEAGLVTAAFNAGIMHLKGDGIPCNPRQALRWLRHASYYGHAVAQFYMGRIYERGYGVRKDMMRAIGWYWTSKQRGYEKAARRLDQIALPDMAGQKALDNQEF